MVSVYEAIVNEHVDDGAPPGMYRVRPYLASRIFRYHQDAVAWVKQWVCTHQSSAKTLPDGWSGIPEDLGPVGVEIRERTVF